MPTAGAKAIADSPRTNAYTDMGISVPGNMVAMYKAAPNSKTREFHVSKLISSDLFAPPYDVALLDSEKSR
jgi:hypothetical protein